MKHFFSYLLFLPISSLDVLLEKLLEHFQDYFLGKIARQISLGNNLGTSLDCFWKMFQESFPGEKIMEQFTFF